MNIEIATDIFMPMLLKRRSPSVFSWSSKRKLTCAIIFSLLENGVYCITNAFQSQVGACESKSCFYSCSSCCQLGEGKQQGQFEATTFSGVRANSPAHGRNAERRCTCGEAVRLPQAEGRAAKRSQEAARGVSVLVSGSNINHECSRTRGLEKIAVRAGTGQFKDENVFVNLVDEQPVGRNMAFAVIGPVIAERVVAVCGRKGFAIGEFCDDRMKSFDRHMPPQHQFVVALERRGVSDDILHFAKSFHICPRSVYAGWLGSCAMRSPSFIAAMVSAFGNGSAEMVNGMRFSRITVLMYTVITDDAERPTLSQKSTKRFLVGASSENVMFAIVFLHSFESKIRISYTKFTGMVKSAA